MCYQFVLVTEQEERKRFVNICLSTNSFTVFILSPIFPCSDKQTVKIQSIEIVFFFCLYILFTIQWKHVLTANFKNGVKREKVPTGLKNFFKIQIWAQCWKGSFTLATFYEKTMA